MLDGLLEHGRSDSGTAMSALVIRAPAHAILRKPAPPWSARAAGAKALGQFYTKPELAERYYRVTRSLLGGGTFQFVEPSAGSGMFLLALPTSTFACDIDPAVAGILEADFLTLGIYCSLPTVCIGNPPFGKNSKLAIAFFNRAATFSDMIAFILPRTFRKASTINKLDDRFHLVHEELVPDDAFVFEGKSRSVPTVFQVWVRRDDRRAKIPEVRTHRDFKFLPTKEGADLVLQRIGKRAGRVHYEMWRSGEAHYFIKGDVETTMKKLEAAFAEVACDTAGKPSLAKSEIVSIYDKAVAAGM